MTSDDQQSHITRINTESDNDNFDTAEYIAHEAVSREVIIHESHSQESHSNPLVIATDPVTAGYEAELRLGNLARMSGNYSLAIKHYIAAQAISEETDDQIGIAKSLGNMGSVYQNLSDYSRALECLHKALTINEALGSKEGIAINLGNIGNAYQNMSDHWRALDYYRQALAIETELGNKAGIGRQFLNMGISHQAFSDYVLALDYFEKALAIANELGDKSSMATAFVNIGIVNLNLSNAALALEYYKKALAINEELDNKSGISNNMFNLGVVYVELLDYGLALKYYGQALALDEEIGYKKGTLLCLVNIGNLQARISNYSIALENYKNAIALAEEIGLNPEVAIILGNIGEIYTNSDFDGFDLLVAEEYLLKALAISQKNQNKLHLCYVHESLASNYKSQKRWEDAHRHLEEYIALDKEILSEEAKKKANLIEQQKQAAEREKHLIAERAEANATKKLLHNTLPPDIADRLLAGDRIADAYSNVSVLFADIVDFTRLSQKITPLELVDGLDAIFSLFDELAQKHGLEKIKTIGDAYMVVAGAPVPRLDHANVMAQMALEMMDAIAGFQIIPTNQPVHLRIGIHSGDVVAGVIGQQKYTYDLWGDAVNTASRMESHGVAGKIHVSEEFLKKLLMVNGEWLIDVADKFSSVTIHHLPFTIIPRGEIEIKGKGLMKTYFLERAD